MAGSGFWYIFPSFWYFSSGWLRWKDGSAASLPRTFEDFCDSIMLASRPWEYLPQAPEFGLRLDWKETEVDWKGGLHARVLTSYLIYPEDQSISPENVTLLSIRHALEAGRTDIKFYGEGFQMLTQTGGTLEDQVDIGMFTDKVVTM